MPLVLAIGALALIAIGVVGLHNSVSQSSNTASYTPEASNDTTDEKATMVLLAVILRGIVLIESKIANSKANEGQEQQERMESISSGVGGVAISAAMNAAQDTIAELNDRSTLGSGSETIATGANDITSDAEKFQAAQQEGTWIETVPAHEQEPWTETYPAPENTAPQIESFPAIPKEVPQISVFPDTKPQIPSIETIPTERPKELGDNILWMGNYTRLSDLNTIPKSIREQYEEIKLGRGTPRVDPKTGKQKIFRAKELKQNTGSGSSSWDGSLEWDVPGTNHRILQKTDGSLGYVLNHDYSKPRLFPSPWYPEGGSK